MYKHQIVPETDADWAHWKAASEFDLLSERCPFCPCLKKFSSGPMRSPGRRERNRVFHCSRSDSQDQAGGGSLCFFCQHLDPDQLFGNFRRPSDGSFRYKQVTIELGTFAELEARRQCAFCHIVMCTVRAHIAVYQAKEEPIPEDRPITISFRSYQVSSIDVHFDKGPRSHMAVRKVLPMHLQSIPEMIRAVGTSIFRKKALPAHLDSIPEILRIVGISMILKQVPLRLNYLPEVNQIVGNSISWERIRRWIDSCRTKHTECHPTAIAPSGMRLIDVRNRKITPELDSRDRHAFVALSYVWGQNIDPKKCILLKENTTKLEKTKSLKNLPKTIEDAITICENLRQRFLWVDRLCIVQDDEEKKGHQIHAMADIFQSAVLTLVATSGDSMESPIPGVGTERQTFQSQTRIADIQVTSALPQLSRTLSGAPWSQRGWTYQESVLSSRNLYFTDLEVWFTCNNGFQREDVSLNHRYRQDSDMGNEDILMTQLRNRRHGAKAEIMVDYWKHVEEYTKRSLTYQSDIYNAFTGILTALFGQDKTVYGLPELYFDRALLWKLAEDTSICGLRGCVEVKQHLLYPSWAWSSIDGAVKSESLSYSMYVVSLVQWSVVNEDGSVKTIDIEFEECPELYKALLFAWRGGCFEVPLPSILQGYLQLDKAYLDQWAREDLPRRWPTRKEFWNEVCSQASPSYPVPLLTCDHIRPGILFTRTQTAALGPGTFRKNRCLDHFDILNKRGFRIGKVKANELRLKLKDEEKQGENTTIYEIMAVSLSEPPRREHRSRDIRRKYSKEFCDQQGRVTLHCAVVNVLLISWDQKASVARRISIGWVYLKDWVQTERTWKTVVLE